MAKQQTRRARRSFTPEFKAEAVRLCRVGDRSVKQVATDLDLTETALREWVKRAEVRIRCLNPRSRRGSRRDASSRVWRRDQLGDDSCSAGGGTVTCPSGSSSSRWSRRARVAAQYLGASSRYLSRGQ